MDADRGGMDRHPQLLRSVAAVTAPAGWPAAWSRYTTTGCAINSLSGKFAVGHNRGRNDIHVTQRTPLVVSPVPPLRNRHSLGRSQLA